MERKREPFSIIRIRLRRFSGQVLWACCIEVLYWSATSDLDFNLYCFKSCAIAILVTFCNINSFMHRISGLSGLWFSCSGTGYCKICRCHKQKMRCFSFCYQKSREYYWWKDSHTICFKTLNVMTRTCIRQAAAGICLLKCFCLCFCWTLRAKPEPRIP